MRLPPPRSSHPDPREESAVLPRSTSPTRAWVSAVTRAAFPPARCLGCTSALDRTRAGRKFEGSRLTVLWDRARGRGAGLAPAPLVLGAEGTKGKAGGRFYRPGVEGPWQHAARGRQLLGPRGWVAWMAAAASAPEPACKEGHPSCQRRHGGSPLHRSGDPSGVRLPAPALSSLKRGWPSARGGRLGFVPSRTAAQVQEKRSSGTAPKSTPQAPCARPWAGPARATAGSRPAGMGEAHGRRPAWARSSRGSFLASLSRRERATAVLARAQGPPAPSPPAGPA